MLQCSGNKVSILRMFLWCEKLPKVMSSARDDLLVVKDFGLFIVVSVGCWDCMNAHVSLYR